MTPSPLRSGLLVALLWLAGLGAAGQFSKIAVPFAQVAALYPQAGTTLSWLLSLISLLGVVFGMVTGLAVARFGATKPLLAALALGAGLSLWQAAVPALPVALATRVLEGASHLIIVVAAPTLITQVTAIRYRGAAMTLWSSFFGVAFALTAWGGLPLVDAHGVGALFQAHAGFMAAVALLLAFALRGVAIPATKDTEPLSLRSIAQQHMRVYRSASMAPPAIGWFFYTFTFVSLLAILPDMLAADIRAGVVGAMPLASIAVSLALVAPLLLVMRATNIVVAGFVAAIATLALLAVGVPVALVCVILFGVLGLVQGASFAAIPELNVTAEHRALANGAMAQMGNAGNMLGTPGLLAVQAAAGSTVMLWAVAGLYAVGSATHIVFARARITRSASP